MTPDFAQWLVDNHLTGNGDRLVYTVDAEDNYTVEFSPHEHIILHASAKWDTAAFGFRHNKMVACQTTVLEFKHYHKSGRKSWTAHPGIEFWCVIPKAKLELVPEKGHSYVPVKVNGVSFCLNVSGGTNGKGWTDWVRESADTSCGFTLKQLRTIFDAGMTVEECKAAGVTVDLRRTSLVRWQTLVASKQELQPGHVVYLEGCSFGGSTGPFTVEKKVKQSYHLNVFGMWGKVTPRRIDWRKTVEANGGLLPEGFAWTKLGEIKTEAA